MDLGNHKGALFREPVMTPEVLTMANVWIATQLGSTCARTGAGLVVAGPSSQSYCPRYFGKKIQGGNRVGMRQGLLLRDTREPLARLFFTASESRALALPSFKNCHGLRGAAVGSAGLRCADGRVPQGVGA